MAASTAPSQSSTHTHTLVYCLVYLRSCVTCSHLHNIGSAWHTWQDHDIYKQRLGPSGMPTRCGLHDVHTHARAHTHTRITRTHTTSPTPTYTQQDHDVYKQRLGPSGVPIKEAEKHDVMATKAPPMAMGNETCGSCYGAEEVAGACCNTCDEVGRTPRSRCARRGLGGHEAL